MRIVDAVNKLKSGIENGNLNEVEEAYTLLTGEKVTFPDDNDYSSVTECPSVDSCPGKCRGGVPQSEGVQITVADVQEEPDFTMDKGRPDRKKLRKFENKFNPGLEADEEEGYDSIDDSVKPVARERKPHQKADVFCQDCRQTISVDPQFAKDPYYCDFVKLNQKCPYANE